MRLSTKAGKFIDSFVFYVLSALVKSSFCMHVAPCRFADAYTLVITTYSFCGGNEAMHLIQIYTVVCTMHYNALIELHFV